MKNVNINLPQRPIERNIKIFILNQIKITNQINDNIKYEETSKHSKYLYITME